MLRLSLPTGQINTRAGSKVFGPITAPAPTPTAVHLTFAQVTTQQAATPKTMDVPEALSADATKKKKWPGRAKYPMYLPQVRQKLPRSQWISPNMLRLIQQRHPYPCLCETSAPSQSFGLAGVALRTTKPDTKEADTKMGASILNGKCVRS